MLNKLRELIGAISPKLNTYVSFLVVKGRIPNLKNPTTFDEKISWLKLNDYPNNSLVAKCADKLSVRSYIEEKGYGYILNDLIGVWDSPLEIDFNQLPNSFVLKWNHDYNSTVVVKDKNSLDVQEAVRFLDKKGKQKFYYRGAELQYKNITPKVIAERFIEEPGSEVLTDYKIYCYNGKPKYIMVCLGRNKGTKFYFMDLEWNLLRINTDGKEAPENFYLEKPSGLAEALEIASVISQPFSFVRTDFYIIGSKVIFGEMTFTPSAGIDASLTYELDLLLGKPLQIGDGNNA